MKMLFFSLSLSCPVGVQHESRGSDLLLQERQALMQETRSHGPVLSARAVRRPEIKAERLAGHILHMRDLF